MLRLFLTAFALWFSGLAAIDAYGQADRAQPADVIVVLGAQVRRGRPGPTLARRARHAAALYSRQLAPNVLCTGGVGSGGPPSEAAAACGLAESLGVPPSAIALEERAHSTEENALYAAAIMREHDWQTAILVTDGYHAFRAALLFRRAGLAVHASPAQASAGPMNPFERYARGSRELAALLWYWAKTVAGLEVTDFDQLIK